MRSPDTDSGGNDRMPVITEDEVHSLAGLRSDDAIVSCYLDVDGRRHVRPVDYERSLASMLRQARSNGHADVIAKDLARIEELVHDGFDRSRVRGVAVFSSVAEDIWKVVELPVPVRNQMVISRAAAVGQLESVLQRSMTLGILAADRTHARVFVFHLDELVEHAEIQRDDTRDYDTVGERDRGTPAPHREELTHKHLRRAADLLWSAHQTHDFDHVVLAAPDHQAGELTADLHPYLRARLHATVDLDPSAGIPAIRDAAMAAAAEIEREREEGLVEEFRAAIGSENGAVAGLAPVLDALAGGRVARLLVSNGFAERGWSCPGCGRLATVGPSCVCGDDLDHVDDVVELAIDRAIEQTAAVDMCTDSADLDVHGRIGAMLRY